MLSNRFAFVALGIACIGAAAGGGYLATRQNAVPMPAAAQSRDAVAPAAAAAPSRPVQETEAVIGDAAAKPPAPTAAAKTAAPATSATTAKRVEPARPAAERDPRTVVARRGAPPALTSTWPATAQQPPALPVAPPPSADVPAPAPR